MDKLMSAYRCACGWCRVGMYTYIRVWGVRPRGYTLNKESKGG